MIAISLSEDANFRLLKVSLNCSKGKGSFWGQRKPNTLCDFAHILKLFETFRGQKRSVLLFTSTFTYEQPLLPAITLEGDGPDDYQYAEEFLWLD